MNIQHWPDAAIGAFVHGAGIMFVRTMERHEDMVEGEGVDGIHYRLHTDRWQWIERPAAEWDGQGLPPVGIECEAVYESGAWHRVKVIGHDEGRIVFRWMEGRDKGRYGACAISVYFRPLRTAEQLAAEQRRAAIEEMCREIEPTVRDRNISLDTSVAMRAVVEALHDAGYRK